MKTLYNASASIIAADELTVSVNLGNYGGLYRAKMACDLHKEHELFAYIANYYARLSINNTVTTQISAFQIEEDEE